MSSSRAIIYTCHDGGVSICYPSAEIFKIMQCGGYWDDRPRGYVDEQIRRQIEAGHHPDAARRFAKAVAFGGVTEAEAWGIIRDRDCGHLGTLHELINTSELPDRWFRNAWVRSSNGGPPSIDLGLAKKIQWQKLNFVVKLENENRSNDLHGKPEIKFDKAVIKSRIINSTDDEELRRIWLDGLPFHC